jgi:hypothetical protein
LCRFKFNLFRKRGCVTSAGMAVYMILLSMLPIALAAINRRPSGRPGVVE